MGYSFLHQNSSQFSVCTLYFVINALIYNLSSWHSIVKLPYLCDNCEAMFSYKVISGMTQLFQNDVWSDKIINDARGGMLAVCKVDEM
jgi:hypothetical protein